MSTRLAHHGAVRLRKSQQAALHILINVSLVYKELLFTLHIGHGSRSLGIGYSLLPTLRENGMQRTSSGVVQSLFANDRDFTSNHFECPL